MIIAYILRVFGDRILLFLLMKTPFNQLGKRNQGLYVVVTSQTHCYEGCPFYQMIVLYFFSWLITSTAGTVSSSICPYKKLVNYPSIRGGSGISGGRSSRSKSTMSTCRPLLRFPDSEMINVMHVIGTLTLASTRPSAERPASHAILCPYSRSTDLRPTDRPTDQLNE